MAFLCYYHLETKKGGVHLNNKILKDKFYKRVFYKYKDMKMCERAGYFDDGYSEIPFNLNILTSSLSKLDKTIENPVVLLSTGGFYPLHDGHIHMMEAAKECLEKNGYSVAGGFFSPCNDSYTCTKENFNINKFSRVKHCYEKISSYSWLDIDTWECLYLPKTVNFTTVIERFEAYLKKYFNPNVRVAYVFGGDNSEFMYCFEDIGLGVCVNRNYSNEIFYKTRAKIHSKNCFFIDEDKNTSKLSSRQFRRPGNSITNNSIDKCYLIRDEGLLPLKHLSSIYGEDRVSKSQELFLAKIKSLFRTYISDNVESINIQDQIDDANKSLKGRKTISLDMFYNGTYNVRFSRLFNLDYQKKCMGLIQNNADIKKIPSGHYTLVDDDSVSGTTIRLFKELLPDNVIIDDVFLLMSSIHREVFDVVDLRDFIVGSHGGGLFVRLPNNENVRVPYIRPFVCLNTRVSLPECYEFEASKKIIEFNIEFYCSINKDIKLKELDPEFIKLMTYLGFKKDDKVIDILEFYKSSLF